jgi:hypothetical protein
VFLLPLVFQLTTPTLHLPSTGEASCLTAGLRPGLERVAEVAERATVTALPAGETASSRDPARKVGRSGADAEGGAGPLKGLSS